MLGAITGDTIGKPYEFNNVKNKDFLFFKDGSGFTDDTITTCGIAKASLNYYKIKDIEQFRKDCIEYLYTYGNKYFYVGYGQMYRVWLKSVDKLPYNSFGNGSAMRTSSVSYVAETLEEAELLAEVQASVTHNHTEGIKGAQAVAGSIWLLLHGYSKDDVKKYVESKYYKLNFTLDEIRPNYKFDVTCMGSVPQCIVSFLESTSFEDTIRNAISIGGDSDTIAAIAGSLAECYYGIPKEIEEVIISYLDDDLLELVCDFYKTIQKRIIRNRK